MKKVFLFILFSTFGLIFLSLRGAVFNKNLAHFNKSISISSSIAKRKCSPNHLKKKLPFQIKTIVIDAGHGGHDPGCSGPASVEKHLALAIAKKFAAAIKEKYPDMEVILTRDRDVFIPLYERAAIANRAKADLFVSIHCNALANSKITWGSETYVMGLHTAEHNLDVAKRENDAILLEADYEQNYDYDPNSPEGHILLSMYQNAFLEQSIQFAERVEYHFHSTAQRKSRGVKQAGFVVLKETAMPSVLVEAGFLTSSKDENFLKTEKGQNLAALALLHAFRDYKILVEDGEKMPLANFSPPQQKPAIPQQSTSITYSPVPPSTYRNNTSPIQTTRKGISSPAYPSAPVAPRVPAVVGIQAERIIHAPAPVQPTTHAPIPATAKSAAGRNNQVDFSIQLAAAPRPLNTRQAPWSTTHYLIEVIQENNLFKYQVKNISSLKEAFEIKLQLQTKGFSDAFIVSYHNGQRISMEKARSLLGE